MKKISVMVVAVAMAVVGFVAWQTPAEAATSPGMVTKENSAKDYKEGEALVMLKTGKSLSKKSASKVVGADDGDFAVKDSWTFTGAATSGESKLSKKSSSKSSSTTNIVLVKSDTLSTKQLIAKLKKNENVITAEPNFRIQACDTNDELFSYQWALKNTGQNGSAGGNSTEVASLWDKGVKGSEKVVAVVDTGIDYMHEDIKDNMWDNDNQPELLGEHGFDIIYDDDDPMDENGHGTHCAGIIGASGNNGIGISGINQNIKLMALRILDETRSGYSDDEVGAYHYINKALDLGVEVVAINNSWCGGNESEIFKTLVDIVGSKGAVSVCAAGNEAVDNDDESGDGYDEYETSSAYPASIESQYIISVAATNEDGELATFSNYGKKSVDIAAPGTDILSTVSYDCYNPSIYDDAKQSEVSNIFNNFDSDDDDITGDSWDIEEIQESASSSKGEGTASGVTVGYSDESFGASGKSLKISVDNMKKGEVATVRLPYTISKDIESKDAPDFSAMLKLKGPEQSSSNLAVGLVIDVPAGAEISDFETLYFYEDYYWSGSDFNGEDNYWYHHSYQCGQDTNNPAGEREIVLFIQAGKAGTYEAYVDDIGISKESASVKEKFGQYDFYVGTSMAAPYVTGAAALAAAQDDKADANTLIDTVLSWVDDSEELPVASKGTLNLSKTIPLSPRIGKVKVNVSKKQVTINGGGFGSGAKVSIDTYEKDDQVADIVSTASNKIVIKDDGWINRKVTVKVTTSSGKTAEKDVYLVDGKASYTETSAVEFASTSGPLATDGKRIYQADSATDNIYVANVSAKKNKDFKTLKTVKPKKYFKSDKDSLSEYDFTFGDDLVYMDGYLYSVTAYSQTVSGSGETEDDSWIILLDDDAADAAYSSEYKLMGFDTKKGKIKSLGSLPSDVKKMDDWTLAAYNGKLYLIGGYDYKTKSVTTKVKVYNPSTKKWSNGPSLPEDRAGGKALQSGNSLVYTLGYSSAQKGVDTEKQTCPANLILTGNKWKTSKASTDAFLLRDERNRGGSTYLEFSADIGLCSGGIAYMGMTVDRLGDTFTYNVKSDKFAATKYDYSGEQLADNGFHGIIVGKTLYGYDRNTDASYKAKMSSGLVKVSAPKYKHGKIKNANTGYMPGMKVKLTAKANKGYKVKSFKVNGKKVSGKTKTVRITKDQKASAKFVKKSKKSKKSKKTKK